MSTGQPIALVTGASGDIGGAIAKTLGIRGWHVIGTYVGAADAADATVTAINNAWRQRGSHAARSTRSRGHRRAD